MNYKETLDYLHKQLPMYQRIGKAAYKKDLTNSLKLNDYLANPHKKYKTIHIAGTNGKGSVAHSLSSVLQEQGYKTGLYTSPHYLDFRERIRVNGKYVSENYITEFVNKHKKFLSNLKPSFFEITVAMAFEYFAQQKVDIAIIEVGLGGRLDSTNIIKPVLSIITNIGFDHTQFLGDKLSSIAKEKAGIIKKDIPVVIGETKPDLKAIFSAKAQDVDAPVFFANHNFNVKNIIKSSDNELILNIQKHGNRVYPNLIFNLTGEYQRHNIPTILQSIEILKKIVPINDQAIYKGLKNIKNNTAILGRWQIISEKPRIICDSGHNYNGIFEISQQLKNEKYNELHFIIGTVNDKNLTKILRHLPKKAKYYYTKAKVERALNEKKLYEQAQKHNLNGKTYNYVENALKDAIKNCKNNDLIFIGGSTFIVADALKFFYNIKKS